MPSRTSLYTKVPTQLILRYLLSLRLLPIDATSVPQSREPRPLRAVGTAIRITIMLSLHGIQLLRTEEVPILLRCTRLLNTLFLSLHIQVDRQTEDRTRRPITANILTCLIPLWKDIHTTMVHIPDTSLTPGTQLRKPRLKRRAGKLTRNMMPRPRTTGEVFMHQYSQQFLNISQILQEHRILSPHPRILFHTLLLHPKQTRTFILS